MSVKLEFKRFNFKNGAIQLDGGGGVYLWHRSGRKSDFAVYSFKEKGGPAGSAT